MRTTKDTIRAILTAVAMGLMPVMGAEKVNFGDIPYTNAMYTADAVDQLIGSGGMTTNDVCNIVTNETVCGYKLTMAEEVSAEDTPLFQPIPLSDIISLEYVEGPPLWSQGYLGYWKVTWLSTLFAGEQTGYDPWSGENATELRLRMEEYDSTGLWIYRSPLYRNALGLARYSDIDAMDTSYRRTIGITNLNQSVQYVNITDTTPTTLSIQMPATGETKDWIVYVSTVTNVFISLPPATWWMAHPSNTNTIPPASTVGLYFSQIADGVFTFGRRAFTAVEIQ